MVYFLDITETTKIFERIANPPNYNFLSQCSALSMGASLSIRLFHCRFQLWGKTSLAFILFWCHNDEKPSACTDSTRTQARASSYHKYATMDSEGFQEAGSLDLYVPRICYYLHVKNAPVALESMWQVLELLFFTCVHITPKPEWNSSSQNDVGTNALLNSEKIPV